MKNKRGDMSLALEQLIKIILSVFGIISFLILIYILVFKILLPGNLAQEQAKGTLSDIVENLFSLQGGEVKKLDPIYVPKGWTIVMFKNDTIRVQDFEKPTSFSNKHMLCICATQCNQDTCRELNKPLLTENKDPFLWKIDTTGDFNVTDDGSYYKIMKIT